LPNAISKPPLSMISGYSRHLNALSLAFELSSIRLFLTLTPADRSISSISLLAFLRKMQFPWSSYGFYAVSYILKSNAGIILSPSGLAIKISIRSLN
jgi:hypothetical protein